MVVIDASELAIVSELVAASSSVLPWDLWDVLSGVSSAVASAK